MSQIRDVPARQSLGLVLKKQNPAQQNQNKKNCEANRENA